MTPNACSTIKRVSNCLFRKAVFQINIILAQLWVPWLYCVSSFTMPIGMLKEVQKKDLAIEAYNNIKKLPAIFEANNKLDVARAAKIGQEFDLPFVVTANGREYEHLQALKDFDASLLVPCLSKGL